MFVKSPSFTLISVKNVPPVFPEPTVAAPSVFGTNDVGEVIVPVFPGVVGVRVQVGASEPASAGVASSPASVPVSVPASPPVTQAFDTQVCPVKQSRSRTQPPVPVAAA